MTEKQLINQIRQLKEIKPRKEWAILFKSQIFETNQEKAVRIPVQKVSFSDIISNFKFQISNSFSRKLAYAFATLLFIVVGLAGFAQYTVPGDMLFPIKKITEQSEAALTGQTGLRQNAAALSTRINDLVQVTKNGRKDNISSTISEIDANALELTKSLKDDSVKSAKILKEIAVSLKTLADIPGTDLTANPDVRSLYQTVVQSQIADLEKTTLTEGQKEALEEAKGLYDEEKYADALERILLIDVK